MRKSNLIFPIFIKILIISIIILGCEHNSYKEFNLKEYWIIDCKYFRSFGINCDENTIKSEVVLIFNDGEYAKSYLLNLKEYDDNLVYYRLFESEYPTMLEIPLANPENKQTGLKGSYIAGITSKDSLEILNNIIDQFQIESRTGGILMLVMRNKGIMKQVDKSDWIYLNYDEIEIIREYIYSISENHICLQCPRS